MQKEEFLVGWSLIYNLEVVHKSCFYHGAWAIDWRLVKKNIKG